jgi:hypothetical protein
MAHVDPDALTDPERVFIAASLRKALRVEELLTGEGVDYVVQVEVFARSLLGRARHGAVFYVSGGQAAWCRSRLTSAGFGRGVVDEGD